MFCLIQHLDQPMPDARSSAKRLAGGVVADTATDRRRWVWQDSLLE